MPAPKRPKYFQSQFLVVRDFQDEQTYHQEMLRRHNSLMHDWGVVRDGLVVTKTSTGFNISPGSAIDSLGREIVLEIDYPLPAAAVTAAGADASITIAFQEKDSGEADDKYPDGTKNVTRIIQSPQIVAVAAPATDGTVIILARVTANGTVDNSVRKQAGGFMRPGDLYINGNLGIGTSAPESRLQIGDGFNQISLGPTPDDRSNPTLYNVDYGTAYLGFNAVRTAQGWRRGFDGGNQGGSIIYNRIQGELCFVTLENNSQAFFSDSEIRARKRMTIDATGKVGIGITGTAAAELHLGSGTLQIGTKPGSVTTIDNKITHTFEAETAPRYIIDRDLLGNGQAGLGFNMRKDPSSPLAANGSAVGIPADRTLAFSTSDGTSLVERMRIDGDGNVNIAKDLTVTGVLSLNNKPLQLRAADEHHGLSYFGKGDDKEVGDFAVDGPVVYGWSGGALGSATGKTVRKKNELDNTVVNKVALRWTANGNVGIGSTDPQAMLVVQQYGELSAAGARMMMDQAKVGLQLHLDFSTALLGVVQDLSPKKNDGTLIGTQLVTDTTFGNCVSFNGTSDYLTVPDLGDFSTGLTIAAWVFYQSFQSWSRIIDFGNGASSNNILLTNEGETSNLNLSVYGAGATVKTLKATGVLKTGQWMHVAATINKDGKGQLYVDGMAVAATGDMQLPASVARSSNLIGKSNWPMPPDKYFNGKMASLRIYNRALTAGEIDADRTDDRNTVAVTADLIKQYSAGKTVFVSGNMGSGRRFDGAVEVRHASLRQGIGLGYDTIYATGYRAKQDLTIKAKGTGNVNLNPDSGNVGIGMVTPGFPLTFSNALGDKIAIYTGADPTTSFGFGVADSLLQIHTDQPGADVAFGYGSSTSFTETMRIKGNGTLQIGKTESVGAPGLRIGWGADDEVDKLTIYSSDTYKMGLRRGSRDLKIFTKSEGPDAHIYLMPNDTIAMSLLSNGNVGIGKFAPTRARLEVNGSVGYDFGGYAWLVNKKLDQPIIGKASQGMNYSIYAEDCIAALEIHSFSDERIKDIQARSDSAMDLRTLLGIEVTDFHYKDIVVKGNGAYKKVIAQQVEKVFPQAVSKHTDIVPDIYRPASFADGWVALPTDLKKGERVRLIADRAEGIYEVLEVLEDKFRTDFQPEGDKVFVFGREVDDFRNVDYDAIAMLNVSATQQLKKEKDEEVKTLETEIAELKQANDALTSRLQVLESKTVTAASAGAAAKNGSNENSQH